jgi:hypothetical protein
VDVYECLHVFEGLLLAGRLDLIDINSFLSPPAGAEHRWAELARRRMRADWRRIQEPGADLRSEYAELCEAYDQSGLPWERVLTRISYATWLLDSGDIEAARPLVRTAHELANATEMSGLSINAWLLQGRCGDWDASQALWKAACERLNWRVGRP